MAITSADVARRAGVSRSTVSYILNGHGDRFSAETRAQVEQAVADLKYRPQPAARALVRGRSDIVVMVMPLAANTDYSALVDTFTARLAQHGLFLLLQSASSSIESLSNVVAAVGPFAVVSLAALSPEQTELLATAGVRALDVAAATSRPHGPNWNVGRMQAEHLASRGFATVRYARSAAARDDILQAAREQGMQEGARQLGLAIGESVTLQPRANDDLQVIAGIEPGTGLACYNDTTAAAALAAAQALGRAVPAELGIIGADNSSIATYTNPRLSTLDAGGSGAESLIDPIIDALAADGPDPLADVHADLHVVLGGTT